MKASFTCMVALLVLNIAAPAQTCLEVVRDSSGRVVQAIERHKQAGGTVRSVTRDASGRIIGSAPPLPAMSPGLAAAPSIGMPQGDSLAVRRPAVRPGLQPPAATRPAA